ncbi:outer membrane beta-barrel protein [Neisseria meningitidis]|uniref:opacity family porin n=1 Tax=Neisseria meningitidis TaxID=487 RepID=UPI001C5B485D|nr:opacity family porin [Neisseria meningitidis]MBW3887825.1 outer membrane beta-barrel protein [Neisseria meningitidis]
MNPAPKKPSLLFSSLLFSSLLFSSAAQAASEDSSRSPYYVQADLAYAAERITHDYPKATGANNTSTVSDYFRNIRAHSIHPRVSVGYDFGDWRIAADYASYRKWNNNKYSVNTKEVSRNNSNGNDTWKELKTENQENGSFHATSSLGLSAIYDFKLNDKFDKFKPYIGARVAYGHVKHQVHSVRKETTTVFSKSQGSAPGKIPSSVTKPAYHESHSISSLGFGVIAGVGFDITPKLTLDTGYRYHNWGRLENTRFKTHEVSLGMRYHF